MPDKPAENQNQPSSSPPSDTWQPPPADWTETPVTSTPLMSTVPVEPTTNEVPPPVAPPSTPPTSGKPPFETEVAPSSTLPPTVSLKSDSTETPSLTLSPQEETVTLGQPPTISPPAKGGGGKKLLIIILILLFLGILVVVGYFVLSQTLLRPGTVTEPVTSPLASASAEAIPLTQAKDLLYLKAGNVFRFSAETSIESQLTNDGGPQVAYRLPKWFDETTLTLIRCGERSEDGKTPYTCSILRQQLSGATPVELATLASKPNDNDFHEGDIELYAWDKNKVQLAYLTRETATGSATAGLFKLHYQESSNSAVKVLNEIPAGGGRDGSLDDTTHLEFSPDGNRLLMNLTTLYPAPADDQGTLFIYDLPSKQQIWSLPKAWTTFAHWLSGNIIIAKQQNQEESANSQWQLVRIDLTKAASDSKAAVEPIVEVPTWIGIEPLSPETIVFSELQSSTGSGVLLSRMTLSTKAKKTLKENILKLKLIDGKTMLGRTMKSCSPDCGPFDLYNGVSDDQTGLFDVNTIDFIALKIASDSGQPTDFDVR